VRSGSGRRARARETSGGDAQTSGCLLMCGACAIGTIADVSAPEPVRVMLEIERGQRTISGWVAIDGAPASGFYGWLELIDQLERASTRSGGRAPCERGGEQGGAP